MVKPLGLWSRPGAALRSGRAAEFAGPDDERFIQAGRGLARSCKQSRDRLIGFARLAERAFVGVVVVVPIFRVAAAGDDLHETNAAFHQPPGDQAAGAEIAGHFLIHAVHLVRFGVSLVISTASGAADCMRKASS